MKCGNDVPIETRNVANYGNDAASPGKLGKVKPIRRAKMNKRVSKEFKILYSNIQGFTGKLR